MPNEQIMEGATNLEQDLFWKSIRRALDESLTGNSEISSELTTSLLTCNIPDEHDRFNQEFPDKNDCALQKGRHIEVIIWRIAYLRALSYGAFQTPEKDAQSAVVAYQKRWGQSPQALTFTRWIWLLSYLPELIRKFSLDAITVANERLDEVLNHDLKQIYQARLN